MSQLRVNLSDWVFNAILGKEVLTLHRNYFRLGKSLERRMYEIGRKHCGHKANWKISLSLLQKKCASASTLKEFRRLVTGIVKEDQIHRHFPDYSLSLDEDDMVIFCNRGSTQIKEPDRIDVIKLKAETFELARHAAPGCDVYHLEAEWRGPPN